MTTVIRPEITKKSKYWIDKERYYELKHFCQQYRLWKNTLAGIDGLKGIATDIYVKNNIPGDPTAKCAIMRESLIKNIKMVDETAVLTDPELSTYILRAVTEDLSFDYLYTKLNIPCSKNTYYDRYRKFYWLLDKVRN